MNQHMILAAMPDMVMQAFNAEHIVVYVMAAFLISVFVLLFYNRLYILLEQDTKSQIQRLNERLALVLKTGNRRLWLYDVASRHYITLTDIGEYDQEYNPVTFSELYDRDDFELMRKDIFDICEGRRTTSSAELKSNAKDKDDIRYYEVKLSVVSHDQQGKAARLLGIQQDVTEERMRQRNVNQLLIRYHTVFNTSLVDMLYYDSNGVLTDINEKACQSFNIPNRAMVLQEQQFLLKNNPFLNNLEVATLENTRTSSIIDFKDYQDEIYRTKELGLAGKMYYESTINPIRNEEGELEGFYMAGRNITEMVESYHRQKESINMLRKVNDDIQNYITNINYALRVSDVRLVNYHPKSYTFEVSGNISETQLKFSQLRCIRLATPRFRRVVSSVLNRMDHLTSRPIVETIETEIRDKKGRQIWLMFNMVPMKDADGHVVRYFGLCRNMTDMVETERRLAVETKKAQETELLKQSFLTNMSYEIRTPLNTVVGFAELFESEHDEADETVFVEEIKRNSNTLLALVNDILFLSRIDANMIEYNKADVDFAMIFESHCQMGWSSVSPEVKTIIENPYNHLVVHVDQEYLGKIIEKLCSQSVSHTEKGFIRAKYEYRHGELTFSIEDSGRGIDEQTLPRVFDRFVRNKNEELCGTGLDLPIVKELITQMGGTIEIQSEIDKGTTVWVTIPCKAKTIEKKREIII
ncbi:MAG: HAMP domain-containing histidine kinase [Prevotella sp.]|nr:HAMP domain-containing histidine kinase [Prevotella sp.]